VARGLRPPVRLRYSRIQKIVVVFVAGLAASGVRLMAGEGFIQIQQNRTNDRVGCLLRGIQCFVPRLPMVQGHHIGWIRGPSFSNEHKPDVLVKFVVNGLQGGVLARADLKQIGNHTASHAYLVEMQKGESREAWRQRIKQEISLAQNAFAEHLGIQPTLFAYPYGEYIPELFDILGELGFSSAYAQQSGVIRSGQNPYLLPRFPMGGPFATLDGFKSKLGMRPLLVDTEEPLSPLLEADNPPILKIQLDPSQKGLLNCFVQGDNRCRAVPISDQPGWYQVEADQPLAGRRNKYTLTMQDRQGNWHWYSHLWVNAKEPAGDY